MWSKCPWTINGSHLVLKEWSLDKALNEIDFSQSSFWVRVQSLPLQYMSIVNLKRIGELIGLINEVQEDISTNLIRTRFIRFNVDVDVTMPILIGFFHRIDS